MKHEYDNCETRELIGTWDEETQTYCNDWAVHKIAQKAGRGIAQRRESEKAAELAAANVYAKGLKAGTWVALGCGKRGDCDGLGFWLGRTTSESYLARAEFKDGVTDIEVGDHVVCKICSTLGGAMSGNRHVRPSTWSRSSVSLILKWQSSQDKQRRRCRRSSWRTPPQFG
jgi:hypothetical protein